MPSYGLLGTAFITHYGALLAGDHLVTAFAPLSCGITNGGQYIISSKAYLYLHVYLA